MARTKYSAPIKVAYAGELSKMRYCLDRLADLFNRTKGGAKPDAVKTIKEFAVTQGLNLNNIATTQVLVSSGVKVTAPAITGTYVNGYTFTIVGGVVTAIVAS